MLKLVSREEATFTDWTEGALNYEMYADGKEVPIGFLVVAVSDNQARLWFHLDTNLTKTAVKTIRSDYMELEVALQAQGIKLITAFCPDFCVDKGKLIAKLLKFSEPTPLFMVRKEL